MRRGTLWELESRQREWHMQRPWGRAESGVFGAEEAVEGWQKMMSERGQRGLDGVGPVDPGKDVVLTEWDWCQVQTLNTGRTGSNLGVSCFPPPVCRSRLRSEFCEGWDYVPVTSIFSASRTGVCKLRPRSDPPASCLCKQRFRETQPDTSFTYYPRLFTCCKAERVLQQRPRGPWSWKYLLSGPFQKKCADSSFRTGLARSGRSINICCRRTEPVIHLRPLRGHQHALVSEPVLVLSHTQENSSPAIKNKILEPFKFLPQRENTRITVRTHSDI